MRDDQAMRVRRCSLYLANRIASLQRCFLLTLSGSSFQRYASPSLQQARLSQKRCRNVYLDLSASSTTDASILIPDLNAKGLCSSRDQVADIVYDRGQIPKIFEGDCDKYRIKH